MEFPKITQRSVTGMQTYSKNEILVDRKAPIEEALRVLDNTKSGIVLVINSAQQVIGTITDGDVRRALIKMPDASLRSEDVMNKDMVFVGEDTPRDSVLKLFDNKITLIPVLDFDRKFIRLLTPKNNPLPIKKNQTVCAVAPTRIGLAGGGSDLTYVFSKSRGVTVNLAVNLYSRVRLRVRADNQVKVTSYDKNKFVEWSTKEEFFKNSDDLGLIAEVIRLVDPSFGFEIEIRTDFPVGSGLGGSSSVAVAILGCFNEIRSEKWTKKEIVDIAYQAERHCLGIEGGWQDQYAAAFGGMNYIEYSKEKTRIFPIRLEKHVEHELEELLMLVRTPMTHHSSELHKKQRSNLEAAPQKQKRLNDENITRAEDIFDYLMAGEFAQVASLLEVSWQNKKKLSSKISSEALDNIYECAKQNGAAGGKLLGAGGGGYFCFFVPFDAVAKVKTAIEQLGCQCSPIKIDNNGLQSWIVN